MAAQEFIGTERFVVRRRLGAGGMGVVYHVFDQDRQADVALKVLLRLDADGIYKLKAEFRALSDVSHPNLIGLYELISVGELWFFTMEMIEGLDFLEWVRPAAEPSRGDVASTTDPTFEGDQLTSDATFDNAPPRTASVAPKVIGVNDQTMETPGDQTFDGSTLPPRVPDLVTNKKMASGGDIARLRLALRQLFKGVRAIHAAGKLHRDIKPSNAMVTHDGRVVLLDFGLASDTVHKRSSEAHDENTISGTPAYMPPEQSLGQKINEAADWYAVGVMIYEALTGLQPFTGSWFQLVEAKRSKPPVHPRKLVPDAPQDLSDLCMRMMAAKIEDRPNESEIMQIIGVRAMSEPIMRRVDEEQTLFLGRAPQVVALSQAWRGSGHEKPVVAHITGPAGIGKSALIDSVLEQLRDGPLGGEKMGQRPIVLSGRCYERESVPFKAFDAVIDALTRHLLRLSKDEQQALFPRDMMMLARMFPVLQRVPAIGVPPAVSDSDDKRGMRRRAFAALKALFLQMSRAKPLVVHIDDVQWGDVDSWELLTSLLEAPDSPPILYLLAYRDEESKTSPVLKALCALAEHPAPGVDARDIAVGPMTHDETMELALSVLGKRDVLTLRRAEIIVKEAAGSPLFAMELIRFRTGDIAVTQGNVTDPEVTLEQVLRARVSHLPDAARQLLEFVAVAGKPVAQKLTFVAAELGREETASLARLRSDHFVRTGGTNDSDTIETYHNRIRETVIVGLSADRLRALHVKLAAAYVAAEALSGQSDIDALAYHFLGAGDETQGLKYSLLAARRAHEVHANHDAIRHFDNALRILEKAESAELRAQLPSIQAETAEAARQAGAYEHAHNLLQTCLKSANSEGDRAEIRVGLGRVCQERGDTDGAIFHLETALLLYGKQPPRNMTQLAVQALGQVLLHLFYTHVSGGKPEPDPDPALQKRADVMFALIRVYYFIDVAKVIWAGATAINMARRLPRQQDVSLAYSFFGVLLFGMGMLGRSARYCEEAITLSRKAKDPVSEAVALMRLGATAQFANDLVRGERHLKQSITMYKDIGEMWELQTALMLAATARFQMSDFRSAEATYQEMGNYGVQLKAIMHQGWELAWAPMCQYLLGKSDAATTRANLDKALDLSALAKDLANQCAALQHACNVAVRDGQVEASAGLAMRTSECISRYLVQVPFLQIANVDAAEAALFALENSASSVSKGTLLRIARKGFSAELRFWGRQYPYLVGPSLRVQARYKALRNGPKAAEPIFRKAIEILEKTPNRWETGVAYFDAAVALPELREAYARQARLIFEEIGVVAELRRMDRVLANLENTRPTPIAN